jgi:hypothetical protein
MTTPTARSITLPRMAKLLNSEIMPMSGSLSQEEDVSVSAGVALL